MSAHAVTALHQTAIVAGNVGCNAGTWLEQYKDDIAAIYYIFVGVLALSTVSITYFAFYSNRADQRFANAIQTYRKHLELAVQWPELAEPEEYGIGPGHKDYGRYEWYVGILLRACEELLPNDKILKSKFPEWERTVKHSLKFHAKYFCDSEWFRDEGASIYSARLLSYINAVVKERLAATP